MLKGIAASAGIAIAKVYKLETPSFEIVKTEATPAEEPDKYTEYSTEQQNYRYKHRECSHNESQKVTFFKICFLPFPHFLLLQQVFKFRFVDEH